MRNPNFLSLNAVDDSVSQTSGPIDAQGIFSASFVATFSDTAAAGSVKFQASNDPSAITVDFVPTNWADVPNGSATFTAGGTKTILVNPCAWRWLRVVYTQTTPGTGTLTVAVNLQGW